MSNKTISISPSLFNVGGTKTKKNREKKTKPNMVPLISPNVLKNKLLSRIKEHKQKETQNLENNKRTLKNELEIEIPEKKSETLNFNDEFTDSLNYFKTLSTKKRIDEEKKNNEMLKQKQREELYRKTIKNHNAINNNNAINNQLTVNIDLPEELMSNVIPISTNDTYKINQMNDVPYGILKGGNKPSYREWNKTQRNNIVTNPNASLIIEDSGLNLEKTARENRLELLKERIKNKNLSFNTEPMLSENLIKKPTDNPSHAIQQQAIELENLSLENIPQQTTPQIYPPAIHAESESQVTTQNAGGKLIGTKHITKKTTKRKYTLGRSQNKSLVGVLIKDRLTRKKILNAQKDLKRKNINDIKVYLREHNLIKTGSNAPNDVLRKLYESAMLAGEITNSNVDTLLYNFSKHDKEL